MMSAHRVCHRPSVSAADAGVAARVWHAPIGPVAKVCGLTRLTDVVAACALGFWAIGFIFAPSPRRLRPDEARDLIARARETLLRSAGGGGLEPQRGAPQARARLAPLTVGVFVDAGVDDVVDLVDYVGLDAVQLHGSQGATTAEVQAALRGRPAPRSLAGAVAAAASAVSRAADGPAAGARSVTGAALDDSFGTLIIRAVGVAVDEDDPASLRERLLAAASDADLVLLDASVSGRHGGTGQELPWPVVREAASGMRFLLAGGIRPHNVAQALRLSGAWGVDVASGVESAPGIKEQSAMRALMAAIDDIGSAVSGMVPATAGRQTQEG